LPYDDVRQKLKPTGATSRGLQEIPLAAIIGSVGRYSDFTRDFLPRHDASEGRWARVRVAMTDWSGVPPIEVYQIGEAYFVQDGNHRVSVARQLGMTHIQAYVTEIRTKVPLTPDVDLDSLILKAEYTDFLERTHLDEVRPAVDLTLTVPGKYGLFEEHIAVHRHFMGLEQQREILYVEAAGHWYDVVYCPIVAIIEDQGILDDFPGRTAADLYVWLAEHRTRLKEELGWLVEPELAAADLAAQHGVTPQRVAARVSDKLWQAVTPAGLEGGPITGEWRKQFLTQRQDDRLFANVLAPVSGEEAGWWALEQALILARRENSQLRGLHVVGSEEQKASSSAQAVQSEFNRRCQAAGLPGQLAVEVGEVTDEICYRARWTDLVVVNLAHPPADRPMARLSPGFHNLVRRCPRPLLVVPGLTSPLDQALLAYDGSDKGQEALFLAVTLAAKWGIHLVVVTVVHGGHATPATLAHAQAYVEDHGVTATFIEQSGRVGEAILTTAEAQSSNLIIMGGYGHRPMVEVVLGSVVDQVLREAERPVLICR
ncbi:MAG: universal stress protein, partial [Chloroflexota bacterium]